MTVPPLILELVEKFERNLEAYRSGQYNETQLRQEFLNPMFEAMGWDLFNKQGFGEAYKQVIHEDAIKVGGATKAPDYCFRIGGVRKFFVEAKKPSVSIKDEITPAFQLRRYAWSAKLPLSILTDFEEFAVYDCRVRPVKNDGAATARIKFLDFRDYPERWDEIASVFSPNAIQQGSFDKYAETTRVKKGTAEVDDVFLEEIESWREMLARSIALRNPGLTQPELNFAVQRTIDRIIFLRICEDRGVENYGQLMALLNGERVYQRLFVLFNRADERYNSGLFHFSREKDRHEQPDDLTPKLAVDDKPLKDIIKNLYYPESPYEFSVFTADILGQVYERFLGKVIRLTEGHRAVVEEKPEVRKAGGVYYTPTYIVDYIVKNTVGKLVEGKTARQVAKLHILDPACGSGSFLIGAYQYLLDWHRAWYGANEPEKWAMGRSPALYKAARGEWRLTTAGRKSILLNNIYGVDIDPQAVEVTKLSLLLKVLEGENRQTLENQLRLFHERALPDLGDNIKCGNSLIGTDFYESEPPRRQGRQERLFPGTERADADRQRVNPFDWDTGFPEIMNGGGFDAVIGNPPYVRQEILGRLKEYLENHYKVYHGVADLYVYFIERGISLLKEHGEFSIIVGNKWLRSGYGQPLRKWLKSKHIKEVIDFGALPVFQGATTYPCILTVSNEQPTRGFDVALVPTLEFSALDESLRERRYVVNQTSLDDSGWSLIREEAQALNSKLQESGVPLSNYVHNRIFYGIKTGFNEAFVIDSCTRDRLISADPKSAEIIKPFLAGRDIKRYEPPCSDKYVLFTRRGIDIKRYPAIEQHLLTFKERLMPRPKEWRGTDWRGRKPGPYQWYEIQDTVEYYSEFEKSKIIWPGISAQVSAFAFDDRGYYGNDNNQIIVTDDMYLLGILNSGLARFFLKSICDVVQGGFYRLKIVYVQQVPIRTLNLSNAHDKGQQDRMVAMVGQMLALHRQLAAAKVPNEKDALQRQIDATDLQIDKLVYELYGLSEGEIRILEARTGG